MFKRIFCLILFKVMYGLPVDMVIKNVAESNSFDDFDNYIPRYDSVPNFINSNINHSLDDSLVINSPSFEKGLHFADNDLTRPQIILNSRDSYVPEVSYNNNYSHSNPLKSEIKKDKMEFKILIGNDFVTKNINNTSLNEYKKNNDSVYTLNQDKENIDIRGKSINTTVDFMNKTDKILFNYTAAINQKDIEATAKTQIKEILSILHTNEFGHIANGTRIPREEETEETEKDDPEFAEKESQETSEEDEEEDMNMITGILSALLGGLSKPDGSIDLEAIIGLIGSLSTQNDDGTYDFSGLTELLKGFLGGATEGGSDVGSFAGGLIGAIIQGVANPPGGKGVGILAAKLLAGILPAISVQPPDSDTMNEKPVVKPGGLDIGGLLSGFLKTLLGASKDVNPVQFVISTISSFSNSKPVQH